MIIRKAILSDVDGIVDCCERFWEYAHFKDKGLPLDRRSFKDFMLQHIEDEDWVIFLMIDKLRVVGGIGGFVGDWCFNDAIKVSRELFYWVDKEYRGGIKSVKLISMYEKRISELGANVNVMISVDTHLQDKVNRLYARKGYVELEQAFIKDFTEVTQ